MDLAAYGEMVLDALLDLAPVVVAWLLLRRKHQADTADKWAEVADKATDRVQELEAERDTLRAERDAARAEAAQLRAELARSE